MEPPIYGTSLVDGAHEIEHEQVGYGGMRRKKSYCITFQRESAK